MSNWNESEATDGWGEGNGDWGGWQPSPKDQLFQLIGGYMNSQVVYVAATLGLADALKDGKKSSAELAAATGAHAPSLRRILRALTALGVTTETETDRYELTDAGRLLRSDVPESMHSIVKLFIGEAGWKAWGNLLYSARTGDSAFENVHGQKVFEYSATNPEVAAVFNEAMAETSREVSVELAANYDFSRFQTVADIGGGNGTLIAGILNANPELQGILFDAAYGLEAAEQTLQAAGVTERVKVVEGDFFQSVPGDADAYVLKAVIHDWADEPSVEILKSVRRSVPEDATLLLVEQVLPERVESAEYMGMIVSDLNLLVYSGGQERTTEEFRTLLAAGGFTLTSVSPRLGSTDFFVIEAKPA